MTPEQVAVNHKALAALATRLEHMGYVGDAHAEAEHIAMNLAADGWRPLDRPVPKRGGGSTAKARADALAETAAAVDAARRRRTEHTPA